ncbi:MAG: TRAP transporter small permease subunit [Gammaproteobacteria bacterium]|nr:TRAP transporter small permease subunit [Gammaproteobacteria bacterium]NNF62260.1 TRAP transporter small permease subunit [Gammaproteobacteria bacterium]NNM21057.1 TRAP transporter small permease subunit [Gammaproteobacteria bacterium]
MLSLADRLDAINRMIGRSAAWLTLFMVLLTVVVVVLRYFFDFGRIWMQELVTWSHAAVFLLGAAYTLGCNEHVRVDIFYRKASPRIRAGVDIAGTLLLLFPVCGLLLYTGSGYAMKSWRLAENSPETGGLPFPFIPIAKSLLLAMIVLLVSQGIVILLRNFHALRSGRFPPERSAGDVL